MPMKVFAMAAAAAAPGNRIRACCSTRETTSGPAASSSCTCDCDCSLIHSRARSSIRMLVIPNGAMHREIAVLNRDVQYSTCRSMYVLCMLLLQETCMRWQGGFGGVGPKEDQTQNSRKT